MGVTLDVAQLARLETANMFEAKGAKGNEGPAQKEQERAHALGVGKRGRQCHCLSSKGRDAGHEGRAWQVPEL